MSNSSAEKVISLPEYVQGKFLNREEEIALVVQKAEALVRGRTVDERTVIFIGQRGIGKSWLMRRLYSQIDGMDGITACLIDLKDYRHLNHEAVVENILGKLEDLLFKADKVGSPEIMQALHQVLTKRPLALLIDTVFESDWQLLATLEEALLSTLASERKVLIVMAGRGHPYPWKTPELRLRAKFFDLKEFNRDLTKSQLEQYELGNASRSDEIYTLSMGNPLANYMLGVQPGQPVAGLDQTIDELLGVVPDPVEQQQIRDYLEALSVLNAFDEEQVPAMLAAYYNDQHYKAWKPAQARLIREKIVKWGFAFWDEAKKGYVLDFTLLNLIRSYLKTKDQQHKWKALHCAAHSLYDEWTTKYARTAERWKAEANYHLNQLQELGFSLEDCHSLEN